MLKTHQDIRRWFTCESFHRGHHPAVAVEEYYTAFANHSGCLRDGHPRELLHVLEAGAQVFRVETEHFRIARQDGDDSLLCHTTEPHQLTQYGAQRGRGGAAQEPRLHREPAGLSGGVACAERAS